MQLPRNFAEFLHQTADNLTLIDQWMTIPSDTMSYASVGVLPWRDAMSRAPFGSVLFVAIGAIVVPCAAAGDAKIRPYKIQSSRQSSTT